MIPSWADPDTLPAWAAVAMLAIGTLGLAASFVLYRRDRKAREAREQADGSDAG